MNFLIVVTLTVGFAVVCLSDHVTLKLDEPEEEDQPIFTDEVDEAVNKDHPVLQDDGDDAAKEDSPLPKSPCEQRFGQDMHHYTEGQTWWRKCNKCHCTKGHAVCTLKECLPIGCYYHGKQYKYGKTVTLDDGDRCTCNKTKHHIGDWTCVLMEGPPPMPKKPPTKPPTTKARISTTVAPGGAVSLTCHDLSMEVTFPGHVLAGKLLNVTMIGCKSKNYAVRGNKVSANFKDCSKNITEGKDEIIQESIVRVTTGIPAPPSKTIHRIIVYYYKLQCRFNRRVNVVIASAVRIHDKKERFQKVKRTKFHASMTIYKTKSFKKKAVPPFEITAFQPLYVQITSAHNNTMFKFITEDCYATPTKNPGERSRYLFFEDKCPIDKTFKSYKSHSINQFRYSVDAFTFIRLKKIVYFHCDLLVCKASSTSEECTQKCKGLKHKREEDEHTGTVGRARVTSGAIHWNGKRTIDVQLEDVIPRQ